MMMKFGLFFLTLVANAEWQDELQKIDRQIGQLEELQQRLRSDAQKNANNAMRWQFQSDQHREARRAWDRAAQEKEKIEEIQGHLDKLKARKQTILQEHGQ